MTATVLGSLQEATASLAGVIPPLERAVAGQRASGQGEHRRSMPGSRPPWNPQIGFVLTDIFYGVRDLETDLRYRAAAVIRTRGGSDANTIKALAVIVSLAAAVDPPVQLDALKKVSTWAWRGRAALGEVEPPQHVMREPGQPVPRCPFCRYTTLRMKPLAGLVFCVNPACSDQDGHHPVARVTPGAAFDTALLVWGDGTMGLVMEEGHA